MSDQPEAEPAPSRVESAAVRRQTVRGRGRTRSTGPASECNVASPSVSYPPQLDASAVSAVVTEMKTQLSALFDELRSNLIAATSIPMVADTREHHHKADSSELKPSERHDHPIASAYPLSQAVHGQSATVTNFPKHSQGVEFRVDDWIDELVLEGSPDTVAAPTSSYSPYNSSQQFGPPIKIEPFDGDPRQWETFICSFKALVHDVVHSDAQRVAILSQLLSPRLRSCMGNCLHSPGMYYEALSNLRKLFGDPSRAMDVHIHNLLNIAPMKNNSREEVERFFFEVRGAVSTFRALRSDVELQSKATLLSMSATLTNKLKGVWAKRAFDLLPKVATLVEFDKWLEEKIIVQNSVEINEPDLPHGKRPARGSNPTRRVNVLTSSEDPAICRLCEGNHLLAECPQFLSLSPLCRAETLKNFGLCFACFDSSHKVRACRSRNKCGIDGCRLRHHPLLHGAPRVYVRDSARTEEQSTRKPHQSSEPTMIGTTATNGTGPVLLSVVPITATSGDCVVSTYALLDTGSEGSLITDSLARQLRLAKVPCQLRLSTFHGHDPSQELFTTAFQIRCTESDETYSIKNAIVVPSLNVSCRTVDWPTEKSRFDHLNDLPLVRIDYARVELLLGTDNFEFIRPLEVRQPPQRGQPYGVRTPLGWTVCGRFSLPKEERFLYSIRINRVGVTTTDNTSLFEALERFWSTESFGTKLNASLPVSTEVKHAQHLLRSSTKFSDGRFSVGLLWKPDAAALPNNRPLAVSRFLLLRKRLQANPTFRSMYHDAMEDLLRRNIAREVSADRTEIPPCHVWYLPHHSVRHPNKPNKLRVVFDASAKFDGTSLNDHLLKGPDLTNSIVGILIRFRRYKIPIASDVEKMFHQVAVPEIDQSVLRFLWSHSDDNAPRTYQMRRQVFGLTSAPASCMHALNCAIKAFGTDEVNARCQRQFYVDNYLDSFESLDEAVRITGGLKGALSKGGFVLTKWSTGEAGLLEHFPTDTRSDGTVDLRLGDTPLENVLGLLWDHQSDSFRFKTDMDSRTVKTRRHLLSAIASLYDPLGFLAPVVMLAKRLLQEAACLDIDWDKELDENLLRQFQKWSSNLGSISTLSIPRWLSLSSELTKIELHSFSDASETAFGAVAYLRSVNAKGSINVSFVMGKTRVAPRRPLTIPRLELQAAVMSVRLTETIKQEIGMPLDSTVYWTDSTTVLHWLRTPARMRSFVAHRVAEILEYSEAEDWRHVRGNLNPADDASRGLPANKLHKNHRWFCGPPFLLEQESNWPKIMRSPLSEEAQVEMLGPVRWVGTMSAKEENPLLQLMDVTSDYKKILRIVAYVNRFAYRRKGPPKVLDADEIRIAQQLCLRVVQNAYLTSEIANLRKGRGVNDTSKLIGLAPFIDEENLVRVGGRIRHANVTLSTKHPIVLPGEGSFAHRIIWDRHLQLMHAGTERVLADLRAEYWIIGGRRLVRGVINKCFYCRKLTALPKQVLMSDLPKERLDFHTPAFTNVGMDFFGPFEVTVKRSKEKRYGCIFTCMVSRAVHLELTPSLNLNSVIQALKRFISRRGRPKTIISDNGTSFVKAAKYLSKEWAEVDIEGLSSSLSDLRIKWKFSPPHGPHFGGAWERLIGIAKKALCATLRGNSCTDEVLTTVFAEVEALLNGRPLCYIGDDHSSPEPLTPFMLLTGRPNVNIPVDLVCERGCTLNKHWCYSQKIADRFWRRWRKE